MRYIRLRTEPPVQRTGAVVSQCASIVAQSGGNAGSAMTYVHLRLADGDVLLPDVVFYRFDTLNRLSKSDRELPNVPPEVIVEVRKPEDRAGLRDEKIRRYLSWGCPLVFDVDPVARTIVTHANGLLDAAWSGFKTKDVFAPLDCIGL